MFCNCGLSFCDSQAHEGYSKAAARRAPARRLFCNPSAGLGKVPPIAASGMGRDSIRVLEGSIPPIPSIAASGAPFTVFDSGMGRELAVRCPGVVWQPSSVRQYKDVIKQVHWDNVAAGADVITTFTYILTPYWIKEKGGDDADLEALIELAVQIACEVRDEWNNKGRKVRVAGCLPPLAASYNATMLYSYADTVDIYTRLVRCMCMAGVDFFLMETIASLTVAKAASEAQNRIAPDMERWLSFTLDDNEYDPKFLSGERIESATDMFRDGPLKANAIIFNCAPPEICLPAMDILAAQNFPGEIGVSPNAFAEKRHSYGAGDKAHIVREDMKPAAFAAMAETFQRKGATIMGGCCGAGPQHLQGMVDFFRLQGLALASDEPHWTELAPERIQIRSEKIAAL